MYQYVTFMYYRLIHGLFTLQQLTYTFTIILYNGDFIANLSTNDLTIHGYYFIKVNIELFVRAAEPDIDPDSPNGTQFG